MLFEKVAGPLAFNIPSMFVVLVALPIVVVVAPPPVLIVVVPSIAAPPLASRAPVSSYTCNV